MSLPLVAHVEGGTPPTGRTRDPAGRPVTVEEPDQPTDTIRQTGYGGHQGVLGDRFGDEVSLVQVVGSQEAWRHADS